MTWLLKIKWRSTAEAGKSPECAGDEFLVREAARIIYEPPTVTRPSRRSRTSDAGRTTTQATAPRASANRCRHNMPRRANGGKCELSTGADDAPVKSPTEAALLPPIEVSARHRRGWPLIK